jgi:flagellin
MANDVVLGAAMRSNLLTLQNTQRSIDATQLRLATGKKINSALDGPQNFFTSQSLNNRASDLTRLLDGIGQSIQTIVEADKGVTALTKLVEQADAVVSSARDELAASDGQARAIGNVDLRSVTDITNSSFGGTSMAAGDVIRITTTNDAGAQITENITLVAGDSAYTLAAKITDQFADNRAGEITAQINSTTGYLEIQSKGGRSFKFGDGASSSTAIGTSGYTALGVGRYVELERRGGTAADFVNATIVAGTTAKSISMYEAPGNLVDVGDVIQSTTITNAAGTTVVGGLAVGDSLTFQINNGAATPAISLTATTTWQDVIDQVNGNTSYNTQIKLGWDSDAGQFTIQSLVDSVENVSMSITTSATTSAGRSFNLGLGDPSGNLDPYGALAVSSVYESVVSFNSSTQALDGYAKDFNTIRSQINDLVKDAEYRGVNLLRGDSLTTFFNEDNTSKLITTGQTFTSDGLGLTLANFGTSAAIETMAGLTRSALSEVRSFGASLANNLSIIQTRQTFTQETINTLKAGASALTDADLNEEGASLLALQTAQQLGVTSLSLASQSQQSVLRLF